MCLLLLFFKVFFNSFLVLFFLGGGNDPMDRFPLGKNGGGRGNIYLLDLHPSQCNLKFYWVAQQKNTQQ